MGAARLLALAIPILAVLAMAATAHIELPGYETYAVPDNLRT